MIRIKIERVQPQRTSLYQWLSGTLRTAHERLHVKKYKPRFGERFLFRQLARVYVLLQEWDDRCFAARIRKEHYPVWKTLLDRGPYLGFGHDVKGRPAFTDNKEVAEREFWRSASQYSDTTHPDYDQHAAAVAQSRKIAAGMDWKVYVEGPLYPVTVVQNPDVCPLHPAGCPAEK